MEEGIQEVEEEDFQEVAQEEAIMYLEEHKLIEITVVVVHHLEVLPKEDMDSMALVEATFHGHLHLDPHMEEADLLAATDQQDADLLAATGQQDAVLLAATDQQDAAHHYLEVGRVQVAARCKILPIGVEVDPVHPDLLFSVNPQIWVYLHLEEQGESICRPVVAIIQDLEIISLHITLRIDLMHTNL
jgi:hypothetical protein